MKKSYKTLRSKLSNRLIIGILVFLISLPSAASARTFDPNNIIDDHDLFAKDALSKTAIQKFLEKENSVLATFTQNIGGQIKTAAQMIWEVGQKNTINQKFLLTTLEKEQGLITRSTASQKALDWATGYSCFNNTCNEKHQGFYNQLEASAETQAIYKQKAAQFAFKVGETTTTYDGYKVTPANQATANLYIYTPHVGNAPEIGVSNPFGANKLFWRIWHRYFSDQKFLDGQILTFNGNYYKVENNQKRKFISTNIYLADYEKSDAINVSSQTLAAYPDGPIIEFADNTLVRSSASDQIYLLTGNVRRPIINDTALALLSDFNIAIDATQVPTVPENKIAHYQLGGSISHTSIYPQGKLFKSASGQIWLVRDGLKHAVDPVVWENNFDSATPEIISSATIDAYPTGEAVKLQDGTFVTNGGRYYLISQGARMRVADLGVFDRVFGISKKNNALTVSTALLNIHDAGEIIDYIDDTLLDPPPETTSPTPITENYSAVYDSMAPDGLIMVNGQTQSVTINFKNNGATTWSNNVWLESTDQGKTTSSFKAPEKINLNQSQVTSGQVGSFTFDLIAPADKNGLQNQEFILYYSKNGTKTKIASISKFIIVKSGVAAQIMEHNLPFAVKNDWKPVEITMQIKNTSADVTWLSRRTALEIYDGDGSQSPFYDSNDWVRKEVAAVPINKSTIAPGETGEFKFTIDPRNIKPGLKTLNIQLKLLDKDKEVYLNGGLEWKREIRVD